MTDHWKSLAQKLGAPGIDAPDSASEAPSTPPPQAPHVSPQAVAPVPHATSELESPATPMPTPEPVDPGKTKKRSSWEKLASMFNINIERSTPAEAAVVAPVAEAPVAEAKREPKREEPKKRDEPRRSIFDNDDPKEDPRLGFGPGQHRPEPNPALEALFPEASKIETPTSWKRAPRVVDDLGWDDDDTKATEEETPAVPRGDASASDEDESEAKPRRRRRRRGGRRSRGPEDRIEPAAELEDDVESVDSSDPWVEPDTFETGEIDQADSESVDPERRSRRRRRRGRRRPSEDVAPIADEADVEAAERPPQPVSERREREERPARRPRPDRDRPSSEGDESREKRRSERPPRVREERPAAVELPDEHDMDDLDEGGDKDKHRNIPSWMDSLQSIIEANMENHNRNDNRGGPPRGRPRSRR